MAIISIVLLIIMVLIVFSLVLGENFLATFVNIEVNTDAIVDGISSTFVVESETIFFYIDTSDLISAGIVLLSTVILVAIGTGISVLGSGLNPQSSRIIVLLTAYIGLWTSLSILAFSLINSIQVFGYIIYVSLTIAYAIGVIQKISE